MGLGAVKAKTVVEPYASFGREKVCERAHTYFDLLYHDKPGRKKKMPVFRARLAQV